MHRLHATSLASPPVKIRLPVFGIWMVEAASGFPLGALVAVGGHAAGLVELKGGVTS